MRYSKKYKCVMQHEQCECGIACLATICKQFDVNYSMTELRELTSTDVNGCSIFSIVETAKHMVFFQMQCKESI